MQNNFYRHKFATKWVTTGKSEGGVEVTLNHFNLDVFFVFSKFDKVFVDVKASLYKIFNNTIFLYVTFVT